MKNRRITNRIISWIMTLVMIAGELQLPQLSLRAAAYDIEEAGTCGASATYSVSGSTLTISGSGAIAKVAFYNKDFNGIESIVIGKDITEIGEEAFGYISNGQSSAVSFSFESGSQLTKIGDYAFGHCDILKEITIPEKVTYIEGKAFEGCTQLETVNLPEGLTSIEEHTFDGCSALKSIELPDNITKIGQYAFRGCTQLETVNIPEGITSIEDRTFKNCSQLKSIDFPDSITTIGTEAFRDCASLTEVTIPENVTTIEDDAFVGCTGVKDVYCYADIENENFSWNLQSALGKSFITDGSGNVVIIHVHKGVDIDYLYTKYRDWAGGGGYFEDDLDDINAPVSYTVTFSVKNGSWDDGTTEDKTVSFNGIATDTFCLSANDIPAVGSKPDEGYKAGSWDYTPETGTTITGNVTYLYTYKSESEPAEFEWLGADGSAYVDTGLGNGTGTEGRWYFLTDEADGGRSTVSWDQAEPDENGSVIGGNIAKYGCLSGTAILDKGRLSYNPVVYICFDIAGLGTDNKPADCDASAWGGLSLSYECNAAPSLVLGLTDGNDASIEYANPEASLPKSTNGTIKHFRWTDFKQPSWYKGDTKISGEGASKKLARVMFKIQASSGEYHFRIYGVGSLNADFAYTITYKLNGGTNAAENPDTYTATTRTFTLADPSRDGYEFAGWYEDAEFNTPADATITSGSRCHKTFYARWKKLLSNSDITVEAIPEQPYTGSAIEPAVVVKDGENDITDQCTITFSDNTEMGTATVTITAKANSTEYAGQTTATFKIGKPAATVTTAPAAKTLSYNGSEQELVTAGVANGGTMVYSLSESGTYTADIPTKKNAGTYTVYYKVSGNETHADSEAGYIEADIAKAPVTVSADNITKVYGEQDPELTVTLEGDPAVTPEVQYRIRRTDGKEVGSYEIIVEAPGVAPGMAQPNSNFNVTFINGTFTITKAPSTVTAAPVAKTLSYNGADQELVSEGTAYGGTVVYSLSENGTYTDNIPTGKDAGDYTVYYKVAGDDDHKSIDVPGSVNVTIAKADAVVSANDASKSYGASDPQLTAAVSGTFGSDTLSYTVNRESGENVGKYVITPSGNAVQGNYNVSYKTGIFTIDPLAISPAVTLSQNSCVYDGTEKKPAVTVKNGNDELAATDYTVKYSNNINAGTADVTVSSNVSSNYSFDEVTVHFTIEKAPITPSVAMADFAQGSEAGTPVVTGNPGNGAVAFLYKVKGASDSTYTAAVPTTEGSYTISANVAETDNYLGGYATADFNILKPAAAVTTAPVANSLTYNGSAQALISAGVAENGTLKYAKGSAGAPAESFSEAVPSGTDAGVYYVWYKAFGDENHSDSAMGSVMVVISKASQAAPEAPTKKSSTTSSITLTAYNGYEYCLSGHSWQSSNTFSGLNADTEYTFFQRISGDANHEASPASAAATFRTDALPTEDKPTPTDKVSPTPSENVTPTPSENATPTPTGEADPTPTGEDTPTPTVTPTPGPLPTFGPTPTPIPVPEEPAEMSFVFANGTDTFSTEYTGSAIKPEILGYCGSRLLAEGKDYTVSYSRNVNAGKATVSVRGKNDYSGTYKLSFTIDPKQIAGENGTAAKGIVVSGLTVQGDKAVKPVIYYNGAEVKKGINAKVSKDADGTETVDLVANGQNFTGELKGLLVYRINDKEELEKTAIKVELGKVNRVYDGTPQLLGENDLKVTDQAGNKLTEGEDYAVSYSADVINAGTVKVQVTGIGNYTGSKAISYKIAPATDAAISVQLIPEEGMPEGSYSYSKNKVTPAVFVAAKVNDHTNVLSEGIDYTLKYSNNAKAGATGKIKISFTGNYKGTTAQEISFTIEKVSLETAEIFAGDILYKKAGKYKAKPVVTVNGKVVVSSEYTVSYSISGNDMPKKLKLEEGENEKLITVTVKSKGRSFTDGTKELSTTYRVYRDTKTGISKAKISLVVKDGTKALKNVAYTGSPVTFDPSNKNRQGDIKVKIGKTVLTGAQVFENFDVTYADNVEKGKATIILTAKESSPYSGMRSGSFKIVKRKVK